MTNNKLIIASFDVDAQKGFTEICPLELPVPQGHTIVPELNANAQLADYRVGSRDAHPMVADWNAENPNEMLKPVGKKNVDVKWNPHCVHGTTGWELIDGLPHPVEGYDFMVSKGLDPDAHPYGACYHDLNNTQSTGIIEWLKSKNVTHIIVGGLATEFCVMTTVLQLVNAGFNVIVNSSSVRGLEGAIEALEDMSAMDFVTVTANAIETEKYLKSLND